MEDRNTAMIVLLLLCIAAELQVDGLSLDVCASCHPNANCDDKSDGSGKVCNCMYGFVGNGRTYCQDKDECQIGASKICGFQTTCHNTYGSYYCTCLSGFNPSNNMDVFIPNDGTHCQDIDECTITGLCGEGGQCRNLEGSFDCSCMLGYEVQNGAAPFHPHTDKAFCKVVDCGRPVPAEDTVLLSVSGTTYGSAAMLVCEEGFVRRRGNNRSVCEADGRWRGGDMICEEVDCGLPPAAPHSHRLWDQSSRLGSRVIYQCYSGYHNVGRGNVTVCTAAGEWERPPVLCKETLCGSPPIIESTVQVWDGGSAPGSRVLYVCKEGFKISGGNNSVCSETGQWTNPTLTCQEILCGDPPTLPHTERVWRGSSTPGSTVTYVCKTRFNHNEGNNISLCTSNGYWTQPNISCKEISCGEPVFKSHAVMLWDGSSHVGSVVMYRCEEGFHSRGLRNSSLCGEEGEWEETDLWCEEISCGPPATLPHTHMLWDGSRSPGSVRLYQCMEGFHQEGGNNMSTCLLSGQWGEVSIKCKAECGPAPVLDHSEVVWHNQSVVVHRCVEGYHSWRGSNISVCDSSGEWRSATLTCIEIKPPVHHLRVLNERCVKWRAEKYEEDTEKYKVTYTGSRDYQRSFHDKRKRFLSSKADELQLCLNLLPVTNYSISITAASSRFTASITTNTSLTVPPAPDVYYREFETPVPTLRLRRAPNKLDPISVYQVFVLPVEGIMIFDCSSPASSDPKIKSSSEYITGQFDVQHVGTEMNFTVGDGLLYGGFFNAPLQNGRSYYIILRSVSQWKSALKSSCVLWAKVTGTSYVLRVSSLSATAFVGLVAFFIIGGYSFNWFLKRT
ncbi:sushi domain-containing protein 1 isoform X2 [Eleginops maclovinus]|uniref:sushi domain-containing protein 1 isoform X2 n=1 Tax=Eleginops maclovinus TaxID=56733 RepID=UPI0030809341